MLNCQVSITLQEDFSLTYGRGMGLHKDYHVRQLMFGTGVTSGCGHFITAIRLQRAGRYRRVTCGGCSAAQKSHAPNPWLTWTSTTLSFCA